MKITHILAIGAMLVGSAAYATPLYGTATQSVTINDTTSTHNIAQGTKTGNGGGTGTGYSFGVEWDVDPTLTWTYTTATSGVHVLKFQTAIVPNSWDQIFNSAGFTLTGGQSGSGASISDVSVKVYIPAFTTYVSEGDVTVKGSKGLIKGTLTRSEDNSNSGGVGPYIPFGPTPLSALTMGVEVTFTATLGTQNSLSLNGTLDIQKSAPPVPEPATFGLIGAALVALGAVARRRA